ncbi:MAG: DEAD/DEAH box helicase, partial [Myxococcales bacterium]|nr:DEAD/DEAH box helicase [Myxococcales bacterium]
LRRLVSPFILRRLKTDPNVIQDLPEKQEYKVYCTLTREQASLYQAAVDLALDKIEGSSGVTRRGNILALLTRLKQICNHPAQYVKEDASKLLARSGKLTRLMEMLEEVVAEGDRCLIFTQYKEMGDLLVRHIREELGFDAPFIHGGVAAESRDRIVREFQTDAEAAPALVLSLKAGGTGLNLTRATHVFHFDRWWNPAVENQATDRAFRLGQTRNVQVHKMIVSGTVEEKIDEILESKRDLAESVVGEGESWITEMSDRELRDLFSLGTSVAIDDEDAEAAP